MEQTFFAVKSIIYDKSVKKILILKRTDYKENADYWDFVGGTVHFCEDSKHAMIREAEEEAGIQLNSLKIVELYSKKADEVDFAQFVFGLYFCDDFEYIDDDVSLSEEHKEYKWISISEIDDYDLYKSLAHIKDFIVKYLSELS